MAKEPETTAETTEKPTETAEKSAVSTEKPDENAVKLIASGSFHRDGNFAGPLLHSGDAFTADRARAVELRANGLAHYADAATEAEAAKDDLPASEDNGQTVITTRSLRRART